MTRRMTKAILELGRHYRKILVLKEYGGVEVTIKPVTLKTIGIISQTLGYGLEEIMGGIDLDNLSKEDLQKIRDSGDIPPALIGKIDISGLKLNDRFVSFMIELAKAGLDPQTPEEDIRDELQDLLGFGAVTIGTAVFGISKVSYEELMDFFSRQKECSSPPLTQQDTPSTNQGT